MFGIAVGERRNRALLFRRVLGLHGEFGTEVRVAADGLPQRAFVVEESFRELGSLPGCLFELYLESQVCRFAFC